MVNLDPKHYFKCKSGKILTSLIDLENEYDIYANNQNLEDYNFHKPRHDYSNWISDVFYEKELAIAISRANNPKDVKQILSDYNSKKQEAEIKEEVKEEVKLTEPVIDDELELPSADESLGERAEEMKDRVKQIKLNSLSSFAKEEEVSRLKDEYDLLYSEISNYRKQGKDVFIPGLLIRNIKSKIKYFESSGTKSDYDFVINALNEVKKELKEALEIEEPDLKKEILEEVNRLKKEEQNGV
jgi:ribosomal protein L10